MALAVTFSTHAGAQDPSVTDEQIEHADSMPLIGNYLKRAVVNRRAGYCEGRLEELQQATEMLEFARRYIHQNPNNDKFSQDDIAQAQRALDREKRKVCTSNATERDRQAKAANLPVLTGTVTARPSRLPPDATVMQRYGEFFWPLYNKLFLDWDDIHEARPLLQNLYEIVAELRARRDGALAAGELSTVDAWQANTDYLVALSNVRFMESIWRNAWIRLQEKEEREPKSREQSSLPPCPDSSAGQCVLLLSDDPLPPGQQVALTDAEQAMLDVHNQARSDFGVPPLLWDSALAASSREYAKVIVGTGRLVHAPREGREHERENLLATNRGYRSPAEMIQVMVDERTMYVPGLYPNVSTTGDWYDVGHYTQIVWPWTTHVGCAIESSEFFDYTVCRYTPPGNRDGNPLVPGGNGLPEDAGVAN